MKLRNLRITGFRNLEDVSIPIEDLTVFIGANSAGKTSVLEALNLALSGKAGGKEGKFEDYDYFMGKAGDSPKDGREISIELFFQESDVGEWPETLIQALSEIVITDLIRDIDSVRVRLVGGYDSVIGQYYSRWEFLNLEGLPLTGKGAAPQNLQKFLRYVVTTQVSTPDSSRARLASVTRRGIFRPGFCSIGGPFSPGLVFRELVISGNDIRVRHSRAEAGRGGHRASPWSD